MTSRHDALVSFRRTAPRTYIVFGVDVNLELVFAPRLALRDSSFLRTQDEAEADSPSRRGRGDCGAGAAGPPRGRGSPYRPSGAAEGAACPSSAAPITVWHIRSQRARRPRNAHMICTRADSVIEEGSHSMLRVVVGADRGTPAAQKGVRDSVRDVDAPRKPLVLLTCDRGAACRKRIRARAR